MGALFVAGGCGHAMVIDAAQAAQGPPTLVSAEYVIATNRFRLVFSRAVQSASIALGQFLACNAAGLQKRNSVQAWASATTRDLTSGNNIGGVEAVATLRYLGAGGLVATDDGQAVAAFGSVAMPNV